MANAQYAILRFAKYKGPEISGIEAHNERTKEKYASNPDIDPSRTHLNFHLIKPERKYRAESECQIAEAGCRTRSDSVRVVEALITATPEFFKGKKRAEIREFFNEDESIKAAISVKQSAEHYGLKVSRNGMACCPFHNDRHPSLKLNEEYFFCFGCGAKGDVIDFVARLFDLSSYEAAQRLAADFGISTEPGQPVAVPHKLKHPYIRQFREDEMLCFRVLTDYLHLLEDWKVWYAPKTPDDALDDRFVEACQMIDYIEYLADILTVGDLEERVAVVDELMKNGKITFLQDYTTRKKKEDMRHERRNDADLAL